MKKLEERDLDRKRFQPVYATLESLVTSKSKDKLFTKESRPTTNHVLIGMLNSAEVTAAYYHSAAMSCGECDACGAKLTDRAYAISDARGEVDEEKKTLTICPHCLGALPVERDRVALFEWMLEADIHDSWDAAQLGLYHSCEPWRSPLFAPGLIASGENVEAFPPVSAKPEEQKFARGLMRRVFFDFRFGVVGNYGLEGLDRLKSMNEETFFDRQMDGRPVKPDTEMIELLKRQIISYSPIETK